MKVDIIRGKGHAATVRAVLGNDVILCGGYVRWMCSPSANPAKAGDIDVYTSGAAAFSQAVSDLNTLGYKPVYESPVASSFTFNAGPLEGLPKLQLIRPVNAGAIVAQGSLEEIIQSFDFTVVRIGLSDLDFAVADRDFIKDEMAKRLTIKNIHCPISTIKRIAKYTAKGYAIAPFELLKLYDNWDARSSVYKDELRQSLAEMAAATSWWSLDEDTRNRIQTLLYQD